MGEASHTPDHQLQDARPWYKRAWVWTLVIVLVVVCSVSGVAVVRHVQSVHKQQAAEQAERNRIAEEKKWKAGVLERAYNGCQEKADQSKWGFKDDLELSDGNKTLILHSPNSALNEYETYNCVAKRTDMPSSVKEKIGQTNGFSGMQSDEWDNLKATWSYNGSSGLTLTVEIKE